MTEPETLQQILCFLPGKADVVLSDMSPNISGVWEVDHARQIDLATKAMEIAFKILCVNGNFFTKVFEGDLLNDFINAVDDTAEALDFPLQRGGVDLRKTRKKMQETVPAFLTRLQEIQKTHRDLAEGDLRYDLEDATIATEDLYELVKKTPDEPIPLRQPGAVSGDTEEEGPVPGKPTLKRRPPDKEKEPD